MLARPNDYCNFRGGWGLSLQTWVALVGSIPATADSFLSRGVMVAQMFLVHLVEVQVLAGQPFYLTHLFQRKTLTRTLN